MKNIKLTRIILLILIIITMALIFLASAQSGSNSRKLSTSITSNFIQHTPQTKPPVTDTDKTHETSVTADETTEQGETPSTVTPPIEAPVETKAPDESSFSGYDKLTHEQKVELNMKDDKLRTVAHMMEFAVLGGLITMYLSTFKFVFDSLILVFFSPLLMTSVYAVSDEIHQIFVPGRTFQWQDIAVDAIGALIGVLMAVILCRIIVKRIRQKSH